MSIGPIFLPMRENHRIHTSAFRYEPNLAASAQSVDREKHLVPRQIGALARDLFHVAHMDSAYDVDDQIFYGRLLCHAHPLKYGMNS
jgi:hypothetical protein